MDEPHLVHALKANRRLAHLAHLQAELSLAIALGVMKGLMVAVAVAFTLAGLAWYVVAVPLLAVVWVETHIIDSRKRRYRIEHLVEESTP